MFVTNLTDHKEIINFYVFVIKSKFGEIHEENVEQIKKSIFDKLLNYIKNIGVLPDIKHDG